MRQTLDQPLETVLGQLSVRLPFCPGAKTVSDSIGDATGVGDGVYSAEALAEGLAEAVGDGEGDVSADGLGEGEIVGDGDAVCVLTSGTDTSKPPEVSSRVVVYFSNPSASTETAYFPGFKSVNCA